MTDLGQGSGPPAWRERLADRREKRGYPFEWRDAATGRIIVACHLDVGFYRDGRAGEVFLATRGATRIGSDVRYAIEDAAAAISLLLQLGCRPDYLAGYFGRLGSYPRVPGDAAPAFRGPPASIYGQLAERLIRIELEHRNERAMARVAADWEVTIDWPGNGNHGAAGRVGRVLEHDVLGHACEIVLGFGVVIVLPLTHLRPAAGDAAAPGVPERPDPATEIMRESLRGEPCGEDDGEGNR